VTDKAAFHIQTLRGSDTESLVQCWNAALPLDAITLTDLERKVLLDANYEQDSVQIALSDDGAVAGFVVCFVLNKPIEKVGHRPEAGFITAFGVMPEFRSLGIGEKLLVAAEKFFRQRDRKQILLAPYTPNYFVPGVDKDHYAEGLAFLQENGFVEYSEALAADALISTFELSSEVL
jgi:mycothiol synthase